MFTDRNIRCITEHFFVVISILLDDFLTFAMGGNQHICSIENIQQTVGLIHQHIAGTGAHKELDTTYTVLVQIVEFGIIIVGSTEIARVVDDTFLVQQVEFLFKCIESGSQRLRVWHIHDRGDATCGSRTAFGKDIRLMRQSRITEVHMVVNDTR